MDGTVRARFVVVAFIAAGTIVALVASAAGQLYYTPANPWWGGWGCATKVGQAVLVEDGTDGVDSDKGNKPCKGGTLSFIDTAGYSQSYSDHCLGGSSKNLVEYFWYPFSGNKGSVYTQEYTCNTSCESPAGKPSYCT
ncbi:MAG: hypothetical protein HY520_01905 [Candidatus Aenigmarchaeota archaeon]|nr:hypothetical protein [Candidatus Aenigmarchaeota archaeon]